MSKIEQDKACRGQELVRTQMDGYRENPLTYREIVEQICFNLPMEDLKKARLLNHFWLAATSIPWSRKAQLQFKDITDLKRFLSISANIRIVLPFTVCNWTFQGDTLMKLMTRGGICEQHLMIPFWPTVVNLNFSQWTRRQFREEVVEVSPGQFDIQQVPYYTPILRVSSHYVTDMLKLCTKLSELVIHYPLLINICGSAIGTRQFSWLETLARFKIYFEAPKWITEIGKEPYMLLKANLTKSDEDLKLPEKVSGGNSLMRRILDHSPNLTHVTATSGTSMSYKMETWFLYHLLRKTVHALKLMDLRCSIPLHLDVCKELRARPWGLRSLHLRTLPGLGSSIPARILHDMIASFKDTLKHLELIFIGKGDHSLNFYSGIALYNLESLEIWGYQGNYAFLTELKKLKKAVIGVTEAESYEPLKKHFQMFPMLALNLELKTVADFYMRLDQGPLMSSTI